MSTNFTPPLPEAFAFLQKSSYLASEAQQVILRRFETGGTGMENTVFELLQNARVRFPLVKAERTAAEQGRAQRVQELLEMAKNVNAIGPTFVEYTPDGRRINEPVAAPVAVVPGPIVLPEPKPVEPKPMEAKEVPPTATTGTHETGGAEPGEDNTAAGDEDWGTGDGDEKEVGWDGEE